MSAISYGTNARIAGILFITAAAAGILSLPFAGIVNDQDYLVKVSENERRVIVAALFEFVMAVACAGIAIFLYPILKIYGRSLALGSVCFRLIEAAFFIIAAIGLLSLLALSREYVTAGASASSHVRTLGTLLLAVRFWSGQVFAAIAFCLGALMYYSLFYQSRIIPRWLSGWGIIAITLHLAAVFLTMFALIDSFSITQIIMALPIFLQEMVLAIWLIIKGFDMSAITSGSEEQI